MSIDKKRRRKSMSILAKLSRLLARGLRIQDLFQTRRRGSFCRILELLQRQLESKTQLTISCLVSWSATTATRPCTRTYTRHTRSFCSTTYPAPLSTWFEIPNARIHRKRKLQIQRMKNLRGGSVSCMSRTPSKRRRMQRAATSATARVIIQSKVATAAATITCVNWATNTTSQSRHWRECLQRAVTRASRRSS